MNREIIKNIFYRISKILITNPKARRLGYLSMILKLFEVSNYYPQNYFAHKIEQEAVLINKFLLEYKNNKGVIKKSKTGISAIPYINLCKKLLLVANINKSYILTKQSKVYHIMNSQLKNEEFISSLISYKKNIFELNIFEKAFFLHQILQNDTLYIWSLIDIIHNYETSSIKDIKNEFREYILRELKQQLNSQKLTNIDKKKILRISERIRNWQEGYLSHIIEPRINWLLDLDLLNSQSFNKKLLVLSRTGNKLFEILGNFDNLYSEKSLIIDFIIENYYFQIINEIYNLNYKKYNTGEQIGKYIEESFKCFKTIAPNGIAASQAIYYTCYKSLLKDKYIVEFREIKSFIEKNSRFILSWYEKENDGTLEKRR